MEYSSFASFYYSYQVRFSEWLIYSVINFVCFTHTKKMTIKHFYAELIHGSIIRPIVTRDIDAPSKNEIIQNNKNLYLIPDFDNINVPEDFALDTSPESYQPPADILKLIFFNHNRLVKNISRLEKSSPSKDTPRQFNKNSTLQNLNLMLTIIQKWNVWSSQTSGG